MAICAGDDGSGIMVSRPGEYPDEIVPPIPIMASVSPSLLNTPPQ
jgi:hypothetical protein